jgi:lycopene cyclase domain-containing protein
MTYFGFLATFVGIPLLILAVLAWWDDRRGRRLPARLRSWPAGLVIGAHVIVAVLYTTPWDNYLVATGVWWYDPALVTGLVIGWVPIEEYTFFVVQTLMMGLLVVCLAKRLPPPNRPIAQSPNPLFRLVATGLVATLWLASVIVLISGWQPGTYLGLILAWALFPVILQFALGADILWRYRTLVFWALVPATLYLGWADSLAITAGTWTINPAQSTGLMIGALPLEEGLFFLLTNTLIVFGVVLVLAQESQQRAPVALLTFLRRWARRTTVATSV